MEGMDGIETMKQIKVIEGSLCKQTPTIALTANAIMGVREMYLSEGFDDYLSKPIIGEKLEELLRKYIPENKLILEKTSPVAKNGNNVVANKVPEVQQNRIEIEIKKEETKEEVKEEIKEKKQLISVKEVLDRIAKFMFDEDLETSEVD